MAGEMEQPQASSAKRKILGVVIILVATGLGAGLSYLGKGKPDPWFGEWIPGATIMEVVAFLSFGVNFLAFIPAFIFQTEKFYDLTGTLTYLLCVGYSYAAGFEDKAHLRPTIATALVGVWAVRLGSFLFSRILADGKDDRFDEIKPNPIRFLLTWTLQGLWVFLTAYAVLISNASAYDSDLGVSDYVGIAVWLIGFGIEVLADYQKRVWRRDPSNKGQFIEYGLWYYSRHPNYCGEVTLWVGMFILCASAFEGSQWVGIISPVFVFCLIYFVSGVRLLEKKADARWGGQSDYENYKRTTSVFLILPKLGKRVRSSGNGRENSTALL